MVHVRQHKTISDNANIWCFGVLQNNEEDEGVDVNGNDNNEDSETKEHLSRQPSDRSQHSKR